MVNTEVHSNSGKSVLNDTGDLAGKFVEDFIDRGLIPEGRFHITPGIARQILAKFNYSHQRSVNVMHVRRLASEMKTGAWTEGSQIAFGVMPDGTVHLVNGQHRLHGVIESDCDIEFQILLVRVFSESHLHALYYRFDTVQRTRSTENIVTATGIAKLNDISRSSARAAYHAGVLIANNLLLTHNTQLDPVLGTPDGKLKAIEKWWPFVKIYDDIIEPAHKILKRRLLNPSIMAVALVTIRYQPDMAQKFWSGIASDNGLLQGDPRKAMVRILTTGPTSQSADAYLIYASHCWDAWFSHKNLAAPKVFENSVCAPLGTPFAQNKKEPKK